MHNYQKAPNPIPGSVLDQLPPDARIAVVRPGRLGDMVVLTPALRALLAHGLPLVTTAPAYSVSELDSLVVLVPPRDSEQLARAVVPLLADKDSRSRLASAGQAYASGYTWTASAEQHAALYNQLVTHTSNDNSPMQAAALRAGQRGTLHAKSAKDGTFPRCQTAARVPRPEHLCTADEELPSSALAEF